MIVRPGPACIDPGVAPGGVVFHVYAVPTERLVIRRLFTSSDIGLLGVAGVDQYAAEDAELAILDLRADERAVCLVAYDGDTGERYPAKAWR